MHIPLSTYRIQFNKHFTFTHARSIIPYLARLGISDLYASPIFTARAGSMHGYDVIDPNSINPELGGRKELTDLREHMKQHGLNWIQDIVPNHMAFDTGNQWLMDILEYGSTSPYADYFDIEWDHPYENMKGKLLIPSLGKFYGESLENGEIQLTYQQTDLRIVYYNLSLPVTIPSYPFFFSYRIKELEQIMGKTNPDFIKYLGTIDLFKPVPSQERIIRGETVLHAKKMLRGLYETNEEIRAFIDHNLALFNGTKANPKTFDLLDRLIGEQHFRLAYWKVATEEINYRRFFTINDLISLKIETEKVAQATHKLIIRMVKDNIFNGLRIDHIDGLYDPLSYCAWLSRKCPDTYTVAEKILDMDEELPDSFTIQGTTGYDFINYINSFQVNQDSMRTMTSTYYQFTGLHASYADLMIDKKRLILGKHMAGNIDNLAQYIKKISSTDRHGNDITLYGLRRALVEILTHFPVYRTYINSFSPSETDRNYIVQAITAARKHSPGLTHELDFLEKFMLLSFSTGNSDEHKKFWLHFVMSFQQQTGALMAKSIEDTFFYIYNRLISLNEVGGNPSRFGIGFDEFHRFNITRHKTFPHTMNATATHDTKRGEDVRARINVLSELPDEWSRHLVTWSKANESFKKHDNGREIPEKNDEYFLYQTLIGTYPFSRHDELYIQRIKDYSIKAVREAKVHTAWIKPDAEYENGYADFCEAILAHDSQFMNLFLPFARTVASYGIYNSLSQLLVKICCPGIPDFYQGTELWDLSLVDPDNRRPVDYTQRISMLDDIQKKEANKDALLNELLTHKENGAIKLYIMYKSLNIRKQHSEVFTKGSYEALSVNGSHAQSVVSCARRTESASFIAVAPRLLRSVIKENQLPLGSDIWKDTHINIPEHLR
ncbi:MAG: malto-oligosyltrehalose synthase, partial [Elusimicrobia bacterium]|nr:malto-oligosyltrehalose synthase [Elusimicrobiota bacterium]MBD3412433.1 malto-oligosyltrehalose synthase [Elusimicrobiota bacterium]